MKRFRPLVVKYPDGWNVYWGSDSDASIFGCKRCLQLLSGFLPATTHNELFFLRLLKLMIGVFTGELLRNLVKHLEVFAEAGRLLDLQQSEQSYRIEIEEIIFFTSWSTNSWFFKIKTASLLPSLCTSLDAAVYRSRMRSPAVSFLSGGLSILCASSLHPTTLFCLVSLIRYVPSCSLYRLQ
jgi:hypothetical protein